MTDEEWKKLQEFFENNNIKNLAQLKAFILQHKKVPLDRTAALFLLMEEISAV
jgi:hypothetical protein